MTGEHDKPIDDLAAPRPTGQDSQLPDSQLELSRDDLSQDSDASVSLDDVSSSVRVEPVVVTRWVQAGAVALLVRPVAAHVSEFQADLPQLIGSANASLADLQRWLDERGIGIQVKRPGETALDTLQTSILRGSGDAVAFTGYVRGQLTFSFIMGLSAGISPWLFGAFGIFPAGKTYAVFFGVFYGLMELIPYLGPVLGATPALLVALFQGEPLAALWLLILFIVLQQLEGHIVAPQVFSHTLRINPLIVLFALLLGGHLHGITGALIALPLAAVARETVIHLRRHLMMEPWGTPSAAVLRAQPSGSAATIANLPGADASPRGIAWFGRGVRRWWPNRSQRTAEPEHPAGDTGSPPTQTPPR